MTGRWHLGGRPGLGSSLEVPREFGVQNREFWGSKRSVKNNFVWGGDLDSKMHGFGMTFWWNSVSIWRGKQHVVMLDAAIAEVHSVPLFTGRNGVRDTGSSCEKHKTL